MVDREEKEINERSHDVPPESLTSSQKHFVDEGYLDMIARPNPRLATMIYGLLIVIPILIIMWFWENGAKLWCKTFHESHHEKFDYMVGRSGRVSWRCKKCGESGTIDTYNNSEKW